MQSELRKDKQKQLRKLACAMARQKQKSKRQPGRAGGCMSEQQAAEQK